MASIGKIVDGEYKEFADDSDVLVVSKEMIETTPITFEQATELANVEPEDSISTALGKLSKLYEALENGIGTAHAGKAVVTDEAGKLTALENVSSSDISKVPTAVQDGVRRIVPTDSDLDTFWNDLSKVGSWGVSDISGISNLPPGVSAGVLDIMSSLGVEGDETYQRQIYLPYNENAIHMRFKHPDSQGVTSPWETFYPTESKDISAQNIDANTLIRGGRYLIYTTTNMGTNWPVNDIGWLFVTEGHRKDGTDTFVHQEYCVYYTSEKYTRDRNSDGSWSSWQIYISPYTKNAPRVKTWTTTEWTEAGGNLPSDVAYGAILRIRGADEPGVPNVNDSVFLLISYAGDAASRLYTAYQSTRGSTTVPWTRIGGGG